ncbi:MAG: hypothetical protein V8Q76_13125 [Bacteroides intestinalis]
MKQEVTNFARFYTSLDRLPYSGDREEFKEQISPSIHMESDRKSSEYDCKGIYHLCEGLEKLTGRKMS